MIVAIIIGTRVQTTTTSAGNQFKRMVCRSIPTFDRLGVHRLPKHYYSPVPDYRWLLESRDAWTLRNPPLSVHWLLNEQLTWLGQICTHHCHDVKGLSFYEEVVSSG